MDYERTITIYYDIFKAVCSAIRVLVDVWTSDNNYISKAKKEAINLSLINSTRSMFYGVVELKTGKRPKGLFTHGVKYALDKLDSDKLHSQVVLRPHSKPQAHNQ